MGKSTQDWRDGRPFSRVSWVDLPESVLMRPPADRWSTVLREPLQAK